MNHEILIVSDNHGATDAFSRMIGYHPNADLVVHCGDSNLKPDHPLMAGVKGVKGNTDFMLNYPSEQFLHARSGEKIFITHGHRHSVGYSRQKLVDDAKKMPEVPDIICYGHTHVSEAQIIDGILVVNPGSIAEPRDTNPPTYATLTIISDTYIVKFYRAADHEVIKEVPCPRPHHLVHQAQ